MTANPVDRVTPVWLRPVAVGAIALIHAAVVLAAPRPTATPSAIVAPLTVQVVPQGDTAEALMAPDQVQMAEQRPATAQAQTSDEKPPIKAVEALREEPNPEPIREMSDVRPIAAADRPSDIKSVDAEPPDVRPLAEVVSRAALQASELTEPETPMETGITTATAALKPAGQPTREVTAVEQRESSRASRNTSRPRRSVKDRDKRRALAEADKAATASSARSASRAGSSRDAAVNAAVGAAASANYRSLVVAELNRRKFFPADARSAGASGVVVVRFTVGAAGRVVGHSITQSSGRQALDNAVHQMMASVSLPPPPGGEFRAAVPIRFDIAR